ncbi:b40 [Murid betaherpesvirus 8]|uniref:B40 n=2 Tax=Rat cytomegalovirus (isolate England) TaxID=1261657 RepID=K7YNJ3_RCMVE|nr:e40 [Murid betaherpesvirus 8]AKE44217.1 a40 [Rat cytomegalovirus ALL-03]AFX83362.1 e40 [Murid betaherpesvirus 8]AKB93242.1 b40 [Murid betaherpesvirus 8]WEG71834.1 protein m40 [Murid betaherpesvirus 8]WPH24957.1 b40 [Murid betaherpesvirus 8]
MGLSLSSGGVGKVELLPAAVLADEEVTVFPDSSAVLDMNASEPASGHESDEKMFYSDRSYENASIVQIAWRRTENVFFFAASVVVLVALLFVLYYIYTYLIIRRTSYRDDRFGVKWTRMRERR